MFRLESFPLMLLKLWQKAPEKLAEILNIDNSLTTLSYINYDLFLLLLLMLIFFDHYAILMSIHNLSLKPIFRCQNDEKS